MSFRGLRHAMSVLLIAAITSPTIAQGSTGRPGRASRGRTGGAAGQPRRRPTRLVRPAISVATAAPGFPAPDASALRTALSARYAELQAGVDASITTTRGTLAGIEGQIERLEA